MSGSDGAKATTLLEKEALVAWLDIPNETRKEYQEVKGLVTKKMAL